MMSSSTSADKVPPPPLPPRVPNLAQSLPVTSSDSDEDTVPRKGRRAPPPPVPRRSANQPVPESSPPAPSGGPKKTRWSDEDGDDEADPDNGVSEPPSCLAPVLTSGSKNSSPSESTSLPGEQFKDTVPVRTGTIKTPIVTLLNIDSDSQLDSVDSGVSVTGSDSEATGAPGDQLRAPNPSNCPQQLMGPDSQAAHQLASSESEPAAHLPTGPLGQVEPYGGPEVSETKAGASVSCEPSESDSETRRKKKSSPEQGGEGEREPERERGNEESEEKEEEKRNQSEERVAHAQTTNFGLRLSEQFDGECVHSARESGLCADTESSFELNGTRRESNCSTLVSKLPVQANSSVLTEQSQLNSSSLSVHLVSPASPSTPSLDPFECGQCEPLVHLVRVVQDEGPVFTSKVTLTTCPPSESVIVSRHVVDHKDGLAGDVSPDSTCSHMSTTAAETTPGPGSGAKGSTGPASGQPSGPEADGPPIRPAKAVPRKLKGLLKKSWSECGTETTDGRIPDDKGGKRRKNVTFSETMMVFCDDWPMELMPHIVAMKSPGDFNLVEMTQGYMFEPPAEYQDMLPFDPPLDYRDIIAAVSNPAQGGGATGDLVTNGNEFAFIDDEGNQANGTLMKGDSEDIYWESMILNDKEMIEEDAIIGVLKEDALLQAIGSHVDNVFHPPAHENLGQNDFPVHYLSSSTFSSSLEAGQVNSSASPSSSSYDHQHSDHHHHQQHHHHHSGQQEPTATIILQPPPRSVNSSSLEANSSTQSDPSSSDTFSEADDLMSTNSPTLSLLDMASDSSFTSQDTIIMMTNALINGSNQVLGIDGDLLLTDGDSEAESVDTVLDIPGPPKVGDGKGATSSDSGLGRDDDASTVDSNSTLNSSEGHAPDVPPPPPVRSSVPTSMSVSEIRKAFERNLALSNASTASLSTSGSGGPQGGQRPKSFPSQATPGKEGIGQAQIPANAGEALASLSVHEQLRWLASAEANSSTMANSSTGSGLGSNSNGSNRQQHSQHQQASLLGPQQAVVNCSNEQTNCSDSVSPSSSSSRTNNSGDVSSVSASLASGSKNWPSEDILIEYTSEPRTLVPSKRTSSVSNFYPLGQPTSSGPLQPQAGPPPPYSCVDPNVGQARFSPVYLSLNRRDPHQVLSLVNGAAIRPKHVQPNQGVGVAGPPGAARAQTPPQVPPRLIPAQLLSQLAAQGHRVVHVTQAGVPVSLGQQGKDPSGAGGQQRLTLVGQQQPLSQQHHQLLIQANSGQQSPKQGQQFRLVHPAHVTGNGEPIYVQHGQRLLITKGPMVNPETAGQVGQSPRHGPHATQAHFLGHHQGHPTIITQSNPNLRQSLQEFPNPSEIRRRDGLNAFPHVWEEPPKPGSLPVPPAGAALDRPNQAVRDELEQFVQLDNDRTERIKKRYSSAEDNSDDPTFGFGKRPQVRGIKTPIDPRQGQSHHGTLPRVIHIQHPAGNAPGGQPGVALTPGQQRRHVYLIQGGPQYQQRLVQVGATLPRHSHLHIIQQPGGQPFTGPAGQPVVQHIHLKPQQLQVVSHGGTGTDRPASSMGDAQAPPGGQPKPIYCYQHHHHGPPGTSGPPLGTQCVKGCPPGGVQGAPSQLTYKTFSMPNVAMIRPAGGGSLSLVPVHATLPKDERGAPEGASSSPKHQCSDPSYGTGSKAPKASVCLVNNKNGAGCNNNPDLVKDITGRASCSKGCPMSSSAHCQVSTAGPCPLAGPNSLSHMVAASVPSESKSTVSKKEKDKAATSKADKGKDKDKDKMGKKVEKEKKKKEKEAAKAAAKEAKSSSSSCSSSKNSSSGVSSTQSPSQQQEGVIYYSMNV